MYRFTVYHNGQPGAAMQQMVFRSAPFHWVLYVLAHLYAFDWIDRNIAFWLAVHGNPQAAGAVRWVLELLTWGNSRDLASSMKMASVVLVVTMPCWIMFWRLRQLMGESVREKEDEEARRANAEQGQQALAQARTSSAWMEMEKDLAQSGGIASPSFTEEELSKFSDDILRAKLKPIVEKYPKKVGVKKSTDGDGSIVFIGAPVITADGDVLLLLDDRALRYSPGTNSITADIPIHGLPVEKLTRHLGNPMVRASPELDEESGKYKPVFLYGDDKRKNETWSFDVRAMNKKRQKELEGKYGRSLVDGVSVQNKNQSSYDAAMSINLARFMTGLDSALDDEPYRGFHPQIIYVPISRPTDGGDPIVDTSNGIVIGFGGSKSWQQARELMDLSSPELL